MMPGSPRFPGSPPFSDSEIDRLLFRGRAAEAARLTADILSNDLVVVYGVSGTGKTSLMQAGVFHRLRDEDLWPVTVRLNDPARSPTELIAARMMEQAEADGLELLPAQPAGDDLWDLLTGLEAWRGDVLLTPVLVLDQFEELFTLPWDPEVRERFLTRFGWVTRGHRPFEEGGVAGRPPAVKSVILIREDSLGELEALASHVPHIMRNRFRLVALDLAQAEEAIRGPARLVDDRLDSPPFEFADDAVDLLLDFLRTREERGQTVKANAVEPSQLQIICQYVEDVLVGQREGAEITAADLGGRNGLNRILRDFYRRALASLPDPDEPAARDLSETGLINASGRRLSLEVGEIQAEFGVPEEVLNRLVEQRLLRAEARTGSRYFELAHDSLVQPILHDRAARLEEEAAARRRRLRRLAVAVVSTAFVAVLIWAVVASTRQLARDESQASLVAAAEELLTRDAELTARGTVTGHDGEPLSGATVHFHSVVGSADADAGVTHATTTTGAGQFLILLTEGTYRLRVSAPGHTDSWFDGADAFQSADDILVGAMSSAAEPGSASAERVFDMALSPAPGTIRFAVFAGSEEVEVLLDGSQATTATGPGQIRVPTPGTYVVEFAAPGYESPEPRPVTLGAGGTEDLGEIVLAASSGDAAAVTFLMLFNDDPAAEVQAGTPVTARYIVSNNGAETVVVTGIEEPWRLGAAQQADAPLVPEPIAIPPRESVSIDGSALPDPVPSGCDERGATLTAETEGGVALTDAQGAELSASATYCAVATATITGTVFRDTGGDAGGTGDEGIPGVVVTLDSGADLTRTTTAADGTYLFEVEAGTHTLAVEPPASTAPTTSVSAEVTLAAGDELTQDFGFQDVFSIAGVVYRDLDGDGARDDGESAVGQALVYISPAEAPPNCTGGDTGHDAPQSVESGDDGSFRIVVTRGDYAVAAAGACDTAARWTTPAAGTAADEVRLAIPARAALDPIHALPAGLFCRNLGAVGYDAADAIAYWEASLRPSRMDADGNNRPCETVFDRTEVAAALANRWVVVVGSDVDTAEAANEARRLEGTIYAGSTRTYRLGRNGLFATAVMGFASEDAAERGVAELAALYPAGRGVFATTVDELCPTRRQADGYVQCDG